MAHKQSFHLYRFSIALGVFCAPILYAAESIKSANFCQNQRVVHAADNNLRRQLDTENPLPVATQNAKITSIELEQLNVFNTELEEENNALFRFANRAHITTEPEVIKNLLLFSIGEDYQPRKLRESERLLRQQGYLYDARIRAQLDCDGHVAVTVITRDLWTLLPEISFSRSGGENRSSIGFRESNFLGWGKRLSFSRTTDTDRTGYLFVYDDPNILSSRYRGRLEYSDNNDGKRHYLDLSYPFFSVDTPFSYGLLSYSDQRIESLYYRGDVSSEFQQKTQLNRLYFGHSKPLNDSWTQRLSVGIEHRDERFTALNSTTTPVADNRVLSYPYISAQWFEDRYIKVRNFDSIYRTEDLSLGWNIDALLGYSSDDLSDDDSRAIYSLSLSKAHFSGNNQLWRFNADLDGYWNQQDSQVENLIASTQIQYYLNTSIDQSWYAKVRLQYANNLTADKQLTLGGENGLRGYPLNYQVGDRSFLVSIEKRYYWEYDLLQLFKVGGAAFLDIGRAWHHQQDNGHNGHVLKDVGIGLRLAPSRANAGTVIHFDVAVPIDNNSQDVDSLQWLVTVKNAF
ncbi:ShlB/FhaC/HecB family hemolysin secretion/activation protein [Pseudoalteromonas mariniglutinosa]|uniref:ShlB/FhaC/HecB family hemolysin secretion/activation protein n=1 Tax=Pseudoalteromonas mariniglutinosa TaxID=206042 RepID=UPI00384CE88B